MTTTERRREGLPGCLEGRGEGGPGRERDFEPLITDTTL